MLRRRVLGIGLIEVAFTAMLATLPVLAMHRGGATVTGWLPAAYGAGPVVGGLISSRAPRRWSQYRMECRRDRRLGLAAPAARASVGPSPVRWAFGGPFSGVFFARFFAALTTAPPERRRARAMTAVIAAPAPIGFVGAGVLVRRTRSTVASLLPVAVAATLGGLLSWSRPAAEPAHIDVVADPA